MEKVQAKARMKALGVRGLCLLCDLFALLCAIPGALPGKKALCTLSNALSLSLKDCLSMSLMTVPQAYNLGSLTLLPLMAIRTVFTPFNSPEQDSLRLPVKHLVTPCRAAGAECGIC
jgi:hypothetical protein